MRAESRCGLLASSQGFRKYCNGLTVVASPLGEKQDLHCPRARVSSKHGLRPDRLQQKACAILMDAVDRSCILGLAASNIDELPSSRSLAAEPSRLVMALHHARIEWRHSHTPNRHATMAVCVMKASACACCTLNSMLST